MTGMVINSMQGSTRILGSNTFLQILFHYTMGLVTLSSFLRGLEEF